MAERTFLVLKRAELIEALDTLSVIRKKRWTRVVPVWLRFDSKAKTLSISEARHQATAVVPATGSWPPAGATVSLYTLRSAAQTRTEETIELEAVEHAIRIKTKTGQILMNLLPFGPESRRSIDR
jgi:hypothetical protein